MNKILFCHFLILEESAITYLFHTIKKDGIKQTMHALCKIVRKLQEDKARAERQQSKYVSQVEKMTLLSYLNLHRISFPD